MENTAEVEARPVWNSRAIGSKKAPKLYATPKTVNMEPKAAATTNQRRPPRNASSVSGCWFPRPPASRTCGERARCRSERASRW